MDTTDTGRGAAEPTDQSTDQLTGGPQGSAGAPWETMADWTEAEREVWAMGPFDGGIPGFVRRVRRVLDVSQRGLAARLGVSQSVVARWETGRTSPRSCVLLRMLRMARLVVTVRDEGSGETVAPMRADGARTRGGSRFPAHTDLRVKGWWMPRHLRTWTSVETHQWAQRSREARDPAVGYRTSPYVKRIERFLLGTPDDHPALHQLVAEMEHLDECREERRRAARARHSARPR